MVAATRNSNGRIVQLAEMQKMTYGERALRIETLDPTLQEVGSKARLLEQDHAGYFGRSG